MPYDPRKPRANPELADIRRAMERTYNEFKKAPNHAQRRGHAAVLQAHLEMYLNEPETLTDLRPGPLKAKHLLDVSIETTDLDPFDANSSEHRSFFFAGGSISKIYPGEPRDPYQRPELHMSGPIVHSLECLRVFGEATQNHLMDTHCLARLSGRGKGGQSGLDYWVLAEPSGIWPGNRAILARAYRSRASATKLAERLTKELSIRFMVARRRISAHTR